MGDVPLQRRRSLRAVRGGAASAREAVDAVDPVDEAMRKAARGDERAFMTVYDTYAQMVYGIALRVVRDPQLAEDVAQEAFVDAWRLATRFDPAKGSARSWLATITHRKAVDRVRSEQSRRNREDRDAQRAAASPSVDVAGEVEDSLERRRVAEALDALTDAQREAVTLAYYGGRSYREVAALLDVPEGTIKTRIRDGLIKLRDRMGGDA